MAPNNANSENEKTLDFINNIIYQIRRLMHSGELYTKELNKNYQISVPQLNCLMSLNKNGPLPLTQISKQILVSSSTLTGIIDRLEQKGLVRRIRTMSDRRVIMIELTEQGKTVALSAPPPIKQDMLDGLKNMPENKLKKISESLDLLTDMIKYY
jgi:DNA-binding MarR family transcriptional regulator